MIISWKETIILVIRWKLNHKTHGIFKTYVINNIKYNKYYTKLFSAIDICILILSFKLRISVNSLKMIAYCKIEYENAFAMKNHRDLPLSYREILSTSWNMNWDRKLRSYPDT